MRVGASLAACVGWLLAGCDATTAAPADAACVDAVEIVGASCAEIQAHARAQGCMASSATAVAECERVAQNIPPGCQLPYRAANQCYARAPVDCAPDGAVGFRGCDGVFSVLGQCIATVVDGGAVSPSCIALCDHAFARGCCGYNPACPALCRTREAETPARCRPALDVLLRCSAAAPVRCGREGEPVVQGCAAETSAFQQCLGSMGP